ncbi:hypothetical protein GCM10027161_79210 [Microbispora hainanensis]
MRRGANEPPSNSRAASVSRAHRSPVLIRGPPSCPGAAASTVSCHVQQDGGHFENSERGHDRPDPARHASLLIGLSATVTGVAEGAAPPADATEFLLDGQRTIALLSDPLDTGANWLGTAG